ncbi:hypothetical protein GKE62_01560 [Novosphingobium sp. Gsoil 351]|nr:hypothetical protein GKE62_01560 [Novosphingobium sp. Gsoil 351]
MPAQAAPVTVANSVYVEREVATGKGESARVLEPARTLRRGDRLVYVVSWSAPQGRGERLTITNPLPRTIAYERSAQGTEDVSVDGGRSWGKLDTLRVKDGSVWRYATPQDVTHIRWNVPPQLALAGSGRLTWSGIVR